MSKEEVLIEALPYIQRYERTTFVIKYGGAAMTDATLKQRFAKDVTILRKIGINIVIVHGGGKEITETADALGIATTFTDGQRVTDAKMMNVVVMTLAGSLNKEITRFINQNGGNAIGLCGVDNNLLQAKKIGIKGVDVGFVGEITAVNTDLVNLLLSNGMIPVIAPIGFGENLSGFGELYNVNADIAAGTIASALKAEKLVYLSDVEGISVDGSLISTLTKDGAKTLVETGKIHGGMIPKVQSAFTALEGGVSKVHIIDGRRKHSLLLEIFTDEGIGTEIVLSH